MKTNQKGNIGEAKIVSYFVENGYEVYIPFGNGSSCDMLVLKNNISQRVSVKTTSRKCSSSSSWEVTLRQRTYKKDKPFDKTSCDLLAVYIIPENRILIFKTYEINNINTLSIKSLNAA